MPILELGNIHSNTHPSVRLPVFCFFIRSLFLGRFAHSALAPSLIHSFIFFFCLFTHLFIHSFRGVVLDIFYNLNVGLELLYLSPGWLVQLVCTDAV